MSERKQDFSDIQMKEMTPPDYLEKRVVEQLVKEGLIKKSGTVNYYIKVVGSIAAAILIFICGMYLERIITSPPVEIDPSLGYLLILHEDNSFQPQDEQAMFQEYSTWMHQVSDAGVKITGQELKYESSVVSGPAKVKQFDGSENGKTTGYFIVEAKSMDEAIQIAKTSPHIKYGGSIEVKSFLVR